MGVINAMNVSFLEHDGNKLLIFSYTYLYIIKTTTPKCVISASQVSFSLYFPEYTCTSQVNNNQV